MGCSLLQVALLVLATSAVDVPALDPATLRGLMQLCRADLDHVDVTTTVTRWHAASTKQFPVQSWRTAWTATGFRVDIGTLAADSGAPFNDLFVRSFTGDVAVFYDGFATAEVSATPQGLGLHGIVPEYLGFLGTFPMRTVSGEVTHDNDPLFLLAQPGAVVLPGLVDIDGVACVAVELWKAYESEPQLVVSAFYAPDFGYAQKLMRVHRHDGSVFSEWKTTEWLDRGPDFVALPLVGQFGSFGAAGDLIGTVGVSVPVTGDDVYAIAIGEPIEFSVSLPPGTKVTNVDTGEVWIARAANRDINEPVLATVEPPNGGGGPARAGLATAIGAAALSFAAMGVIRLVRLRGYHRRRDKDTHLRNTFETNGHAVAARCIAAKGGGSSRTRPGRAWTTHTA
ncbi:MAG: hypothetical protein SGJ11_17405 [Phycisphaerae bacterium]|nr:hypothetical protein [Phycisphaerae bacterium]